MVDRPKRFYVVLMEHPWRWTGAVLLAVLLPSSGCAPLGPGSIQAARFDYNEAIARSWNEQLLLNLVRLRYRDTPQFVQIGSVLARYSLQTGVKAGVDVGTDVSSRTVVSGGLNVAYEEAPTITYVPLQGEEFSRHLLAPIGPQPLFLLAQSGWSIERLLRCCVQQINGVPNAPSTAGPTPARAPDARDFLALSRLLRELQTEGHLSGMLDGVDANRAPLDLQSPRFLLGTGAGDPRLSELRRRLALDASCCEFPVRSGLGPGSGCAVVLQTRSLLGVMFFLSLGVEVPEADLAEGLATTTLGTDGKPYDWQQLVGGLFRVRHSETRPEHAYAAVRYRGRWWYVDDADLDSKSTFFLLTWLFNLQASTTPPAGPMLTVGARG